MHENGVATLYDIHEKRLDRLEGGYLDMVKVQTEQTVILKEVRDALLDLKFSFKEDTLRIKNLEVSGETVANWKKLIKKSILPAVLSIGSSLLALISEHFLRHGH